MQAKLTITQEVTCHFNSGYGWGGPVVVSFVGPKEKRVVCENWKSVGQGAGGGGYY